MYCDKFWVTGSRAVFSSIAVCRTDRVTQPHTTAVMMHIEPNMTVNLFTNASSVKTKLLSGERRQQVADDSDKRRSENHNEHSRKYEQDHRKHHLDGQLGRRLFGSLATFGSKRIGERP